MVERSRFAPTVVVTALLFALPVRAAPPQPTAPPRITESRIGADAAAFAEERMHAGDCAAALDAFDQALRKVFMPELQRDRGICHEKLGHPFPAMDDYRAYLDARPDAADADQIRARLDQLEAQNGVVKPAARSPNGSSTSERVDVSLGGAHGVTNLDTLEHYEALDQQADTSPVRRGRGFALALHFDVAHYGQTTFGWAEGAGVDLRYSLSSVSSVLLGLQYMDVNSGGTASSLSGPGFIAGYEARIALDKRVSDAFLLGATFGYENLSQSATGFVFDIIEPKVRLGYRHVFGPTFGVEASLDGGPAWVHLSAAPAGFQATTSTSVLGGHVGIVMGF